jgi:acyl transferase domain-containing protein/NADPH:quinone reductase-like Zn-dependent oxidoreductase/acyl carrier protein
MVGARGAQVVAAPKGNRDVVVVGRACRLPGAPTLDHLWKNLKAGHCSVGRIPEDRWSLDKHGHPRQRESGKSYVWSAGTVEDIWSFDPSVFGISPREVEQMDPQQRLLLELTWEALEDAGIRRSDVAGTDVGVFVGASSTEYQTVRNADIAGADGYSATGGALSIVSNRISYVFDFRGPSFTVDTACSSSLVALNQALAALRSGVIDTAIVGGVNVLLSPYGFVLFSQASMLSPGGLCRTFDAKADGYVRAEGGVVLVLRTAKRAARDNNPVHGRIIAAGVNSDGRTNGIALPSRDSQRQLLKDVYRRAGIHPAKLSFVEAHGTGTRVGDPIEASVIGEVLGKQRTSPLLVGSIKSNIGHLEPGSGLAGVLKALLAFEHDILPPSVNFDEPNPDIDFDDLNIAVCTGPTPIPRGDGPRYAGINSFGFGGTNAHVIVGDVPARPKRAAAPAYSSDLFVLSAATQPALRALARRYAERLGAASFEEAREVVAAAAHQRDLLAERAIVTWNSPRDLIRKLERIADKEAEVPGVVWGTVTETKAPVAFVFSGNGAQWPGMGRDAYRASRRFRESFDEIDAIFDAKFGWSVTEALFAEDLAERLRFTHIAQPLIFSVQVSVARALRAEGLEPFCVVGHSVGEIAAATIAGALSLKEAVAVIQARSNRQEVARDLGRMAVLVATREQVEALCAEIGDVAIAAENASRAYTVAGPTEAIARLGKLAHRRRIVFRQLDLDYPFHCRLVDAVEAPILEDLADLAGSRPNVRMISTVTGELVTQPLGAAYWWRNIREPVKFSTAIDRAAQLGARIFVEIGPRSILLSNMNETLEATGLPCATMGVLERSETAGGADPIRPAVLSAVTRGADVALDVLFGPKPNATVPLPTYPWAKREFRHAETGESVGSTMAGRWHALLGGRAAADGLDWSRLLDSTLLPELADHEVGGQAILPGAAFVEIALAAAREWLDCERPELHELDITQPLPIEKDRTRELKVRVSPSTSSVEILSRPRLTRGGWTSHALAQVSRGREGPSDRPESLPQPDAVIGADAIYAAAESVGLRYGPAFRLLRSAARAGERSLVVELAPTEAADPRYGIDPARLDACFHGLFALFGELGARNRGTAYIPVRFGQVRIDRPGAKLARAIIEVTRASQGSILADFILLDEEGRRIGHLLDARFQAARVERASTLAEKALVSETVAIDAGSIGRPGCPVTAADVLGVASPWLGRDEEDLRTSDQLLLEGWASAAGLAIARRLAGGDHLPAERLTTLAPQTRAWLLGLLRGLEGSELAKEADTGWSLAAADSLPPPDAILRTLASDHPERSSELLLAGRIGAWSPDDAASGEDAHWLSSGVLDGYDLGGIAARASGEVVLGLLAAARLLDRKPGLRVLQVGFGPLSFGLAKLARHAEARLTVLDPDSRRVERARLALEGGHLAFLDDPESLPAAGFDLVVSAEGLHRFAEGGVRLQSLRTALAPGGLLIAVEPVPSLFRDLALGLSPGWFGEGANRSHGSLLLAGEWTRDLEANGFSDVSALAIRTAAEEATLLLAQAESRAVSSPDVAKRPIVIQSTRREGVFGLADRLAALLDIDMVEVMRTELGGTLETPPVAGTIVVCFLDAPSAQGSVSALREGALALMAAAELCPRGKGELWVVLRTDGSGADPVATGLAAFARTLANENATLTVRRITIEGGLEPTATAAALRALLRNPQAETDIVLGPSGTRALRFVGLDQVSERASARPGEPEAAMLERGAGGGLAGLHWQACARRDPQAGEVEIAVEATGLNFRDVMWAMSLLPDDILEDGFAGPTLGLECAGKVARVGPGTSRFRVGDRVLAFAPSAFSTSVTVPEGVVMPIPAHWRTEAAAGVPVAFLTAYYGLVTLGRLKAGDWVLVHGAAGGVGLAAIQIAHWCGATVVATAGSPEKRDLLRALGVEHVLGSRSTAFAEDIRAIRRQGVDVVLNSLSAEAMERSIATLKPFGRFIELGKRDYVANTRIGLRPFKRNLSYFGVDVDQLLSDNDRASEIFAELMRLFEAGDLSPLPYRVFGESETLDAFRLMQQSGHVGKILLRPSREARATHEPPAFHFDPERTHLLTGGFGGFGLEAARWLADQGVRHLVLLGRSGAASEEAQALVAELEDRGVTVAALSCDVSNTRAVRRALDTIRTTMPPLAGILHGAMVLEDALTANLSADQLTRVLAPKVAGADNLDRLTAEDGLDYFVMFSSITTFIGNPGQGAYVAANGYLEGLARQRRARGLPGLALAWGAISDVGVLARKKGLAEALAKRVGVVGMPAREALGLMAEALAREAEGGPAAIAVGSLDWGAAKRLPALASPTFASLTRGGGTADVTERQTIDLRALMASEAPETVRKRVAEVIVEEIATVLRVPKQDISPTKRLGELGLDSLMAIELASALQDRLGLDDPPAGSVATMSTLGLADQLITLVSSGQADDDERAAVALNERHVGGELDTAAIAPAIKAVAERSRDLKGLMH